VVPPWRGGAVAPITSLSVSTINHRIRAAEKYAIFRDHELGRRCKRIGRRQ
jgi:hypothetical protein